MNFSQGGKIGECLTRKGGIDRYVIILVSPLFFLFLLCQLPSLLTHQHTPRKLFCSGLFHHMYKADRTDICLGFLHQVKHAELNSRGLGIEIFIILRDFAQSKSNRTALQLAVSTQNCSCGNNPGGSIQNPKNTFNFKGAKNVECPKFVHVSILVILLISIIITIQMKEMEKSQR